MNRRLFWSLIRKLERLPRDKFNYNDWFSSDWMDEPVSGCGTNACAAGWACTLPSFRRAGLRRDHLDVTINYGRRDLIGHYAMAHVLGISYEHASHLFIPRPPLRNDVGPKTVARLLRYYMKHGTTEGFRYKGQRRGGTI